MAVNNFLGIPEKTLKTDILSTDSTFKLQDIKWYTDSTGTDVNLTASDFGSSNTGYGVFEPRTSKQEFFTWDTSTVANYATTGITISARGLPWGNDYTTAATTRKFDHPAGSKVLLYTNAPALYNTFANKANAETITGAWTHSAAIAMGTNKITGLGTPTADTDACTKKYADDLAIAGAPDASTTVKGIVEEATGAELAAGTATGGTGARLFAPSAQCKNSSAGAGDANKIPVLDANGVLDTSFLPNPLSRTVDQLQITGTPDSGNDAVNKTYVDTMGEWGIYGDGSDGAGTISSNTTLSTDKYYTTLTVDAGKTLNTNGFRVFARTSITNNGTISNVGGAGAAGGNNAGLGATGGTAGTAGAAGTLPGGYAGGAGADSNPAVGAANGQNGSAGSNSTRAWASATGKDGGAGGNSTSNTGGTAGGGGTNSGTVVNYPRNIVSATMPFDMNGTSIAQITTAPGSGGGGSGAQDTTNSGGAGGGGGGSGGWVYLASPTITNSGTGTISAAGGAGGNGGSGVTNGAKQGGGGGGGGGNGGIVILVYRTLTNSGTITVAGGAAGTGGAAGGGGGTAGANGTAGAAGKIVYITHP